MIVAEEPEGDITTAPQAARATGAPTETLAGEFPTAKQLLAARCAERLLVPGERHDEPDALRQALTASVLAGEARQVVERQLRSLRRRSKSEFPSSSVALRSAQIAGSPLPIPERAMRLSLTIWRISALVISRSPVRVSISTTRAASCWVRPRPLLVDQLERHGSRPVSLAK